MTETIGTAGQSLERLSALHRSLMRKFATAEGLQLVHVEILQYLSICNRYSDTTQAISEYLGQTKGSISQSLGHLETNHFVKRVQDGVDKRIFHLSLSAKGRAVTERLSTRVSLDGIAPIERALQSLIASVQKENGLQGFGTCASCKFNRSPGKRQFVCGLTNEKLSVEDVKKICREHRAA